MNDAGSALWPCEQTVVRSVVSYLARQGWTIESVADTESRARRADVRADRSGEILIVEAKGYPSDFYARGVNKGKPKPTKPSVQARHWYSHVILDAVLRQSQYPSATVMIALPDFPAFTNLISRTQHALAKLNINVLLVDKNGNVENLYFSDPAAGPARST